MTTTTHMGADFFSGGRRECLKNFCAPKNGSRGGDTFCPPRGGVEGGMGGGTSQIFTKENRDLCENMRKKSKVFKQHKGHLFT